MTEAAEIANYYKVSELTQTELHFKILNLQKRQELLTLQLIQVNKDLTVLYNEVSA